MSRKIEFAMRILISLADTPLITVHFFSQFIDENYRELRFCGIETFIQITEAAYLASEVRSNVGHG